MVPTLAGAAGGGIVYSDGQFNDSRLAVALARTAEGRGAALLNYARVEGLLKDRGRVSGATVRDVESGDTFDVRARVVVNATGVGVDALRRMDEPGARPLVSASQGIHVVLDRSFLPGETALMVPRTSDGRVFFVIPWEGRCLAGTTDTPVPDPAVDPLPLEEELDFVLSHTGRYLDRRPERSDVLAVFAGLRPLVSNGSLDTSRLSRDHTLVVSPSGLVTITGGKWTTYRRMARDTVDRAAHTAGLPSAPCVTEGLRLHGAEAAGGPWREFGAAPDEIARYEVRYPGGLHPRLPYTRAMAAYVI
jgi:glycerol-3-phosphate dehydrogenase